MEIIFTDKQRIKADFILNNANAKLSRLENFELKELAIVWSYYSGKIEGNTYSYVETDTLLKEGITSPKRYEDARMLKNLYNVFVKVVQRIKGGDKITIDKNAILLYHTLLTDGLVKEHDKGIFRNRPVRITGTFYIPPQKNEEIVPKFDDIMFKQHNYKHPLEQAIFLHCNIARLQPFIDGNKRTSRLIESIILMNHDVIPTYSGQNDDINRYKSAILHFYEYQEYAKYADYFLNRQIQRINEVSMDTEIKFDLETNKEIPPKSISKNKKMNI